MWRPAENEILLNKVFENHNDIVVLDTETTGLNAEKDCIIQFSAIKYEVTEDFDISEIGNFNTYINPEYEIPPKITEITGITDEMLADAPVESDIFPKIIEFMGDTPVIAAYNTPFDKKFIEKMYIRNGVEFTPSIEMDVLKMARDIVSKDESKSHKLGDIAAMYGVDYGLTFHNSFDDVTATARLIPVFYKEYKEKAAQRLEYEKEMLGRPKLVANVNHLGYWPGYNGKPRIYIQTNLGSFYYDIRNKAWDKKPDNPHDILEVDMEKLRTDAFALANVDNEEDFSRYKG